MNVKVNGLRVGLLTAMLAVCAAGCKKGPFGPMPKGFTSQKMEQVVDSFYREGLKYANNPEYQSVRQDTISMSDYYAHCPGEFADRLNRICHDNNYVTDNNGVEHRINSYEDSKLVVSSNQIFTPDSVKAYIAVEEYAKVK